jgi:hypothetical protein
MFLHEFFTQSKIHVHYCLMTPTTSPLCLFCCLLRVYACDGRRWSSTLKWWSWPLSTSASKPGPQLFTCAALLTPCLIASRAVCDSPRLSVEVNDGLAVINALHASIQAARDKYKGVAFAAPTSTSASTASTSTPAPASAAAADSKAAPAPAPAPAAAPAKAAGGGGSSAKDKRKKKKESEAKREQTAMEQKRAAALAAAAAATPGPEHPEIEKLKRDVIIVDINNQV